MRVNCDQVKGGEGGGGVVGGQSQKDFFGPFGPQLIWSKNKGPVGGLP